jgi:predicted NUDIX family NTP pyrophosphohydrolase
MEDGSWRYFLARRSEWCHQGGCWAIPGGALHQGEEPIEGALREFVEEIGDVLGGTARRNDADEGQRDPHPVPVGVEAAVLDGGGADLEPRRSSGQPGSGES